MSKKYGFFKRFASVADMKRHVTTLFTNKYYNLWMNKYTWNGLDEDVKEQQENYIMRKFWSEGRVAVRNVKNLDMVVFCPFAEVEQNLYDFPEVVTLINSRKVSTRIIPQTPQRVNKDVCIIYAQPNRKPIKAMVDYYIERMAQVEMVINTNLCLQKMPYIIGVTEEDKAQAEDVINRILNDEVVIFTAIGDIQKLQAIVTQAPYIIDKLRTYQVSIENELLTFLGIDNTGAQEKAAQMTLSEVNANNDVIDDYGNAITDEIKKWLDRANTVLGRSFSIESKSTPVGSVDRNLDITSPTEEEDGNVED